MTMFDERVDGLTDDETAGPAFDFETATALDELSDHLRRFVGRLAPAPFGPSARPGDRVETVVAASVPRKCRRFIKCWRSGRPAEAVD